MMRDVADRVDFDAGTVPALGVTNLSKTFAGETALDALSLTVAPGEIHALLGENGSGKSTLIKIISGYHRPDPGGLVAVAGRSLDFGSADSAYSLGVRVVHQDLGLVHTSSVADNLSFNTGFVSRWGTVRTRAEIRRATDDLARVNADVDACALISTLSPALRTGVAVARALRHDARAPARLLVLDEPTATLPIAEVGQLLAMVRAIAAQHVGILYVTHRLDEVFELSDRVTVLRDGHKITTALTETLNRRQLIELLVGHEFDEASAASAALPTVQGEPILEVRGLVAGPLQDVSVDIFPGEVVGIAGITGSGRESLLPALFGALDREVGVVRVAGELAPPLRPDAAINRGMAYLPPDRKTQGGIMDMTARENLTVVDLRPFWKRLWLQRRSETTEVRRWFDDLAVRPADGFDRPLTMFSGGNQQKVLFAKWLRCAPKVLLLDEPTQGVDVPAKAILHRRLLQAAADGAAVVISSADLDELVALCHRVLVLRDGQIVAELEDASLTVPIISHHSLGTREEPSA